MNRTWWEHLQTTAPTALGACTTRFAQKFPKDWRRRIQTPTELEQYFYEMHKIEVHNHRRKGAAQEYGFRVQGQRWRISRDTSYFSADEARWAALQAAFGLVEAEHRRVNYVRPSLHQPVRRQPKDEKKNLPRVDWREH